MRDGFCRLTIGTALLLLAVAADAEPLRITSGFYGLGSFHFVGSGFDTGFVDEEEEHEFLLPAIPDPLRTGAVVNLSISTITNSAGFLNEAVLIDITGPLRFRAAPTQLTCSPKSEQCFASSPFIFDAELTLRDKVGQLLFTRQLIGNGIATAVIGPSFADQSVFQRLTYTFRETSTPTPEPATLLTVALAGIVVVVRRRRV